SRERRSTSPPRSVTTASPEARASSSVRKPLVSAACRLSTGKTVRFSYTTGSPSRQPFALGRTGFCAPVARTEARQAVSKARPSNPQVKPFPRSIGILLSSFGHPPLGRVPTRNEPEAFSCRPLLEILAGRIGEVSNFELGLCPGSRPVEVG